MPGQREQLAESGQLPGSDRLPESDRLPGSQRPAEPRRSPEAPRPHEAREARDIGAELRARLERLPLSHPSCPYNPDGSRKPPEPDPRERELPLPREAGRTDLPEEDGPRIDPDGSWHWKGRDLSPEQNRIADEALARFRTAEGRDADGNYGDHGLTPAMRRIEARLEHGRLVPDTEKFALKSPDRLKEKLAARIVAQPGEPVSELAARIHDGIRYTYVYEEAHYTGGLYDTEAAIKQSGYSPITRKPSWDSPEYKGINSQWLDPLTGCLFEVQFHTHASWEAKEITHSAYEKLADPRTGPEERQMLEEHQRKISDGLSVPPGALEISYYRERNE